MTVLAIPDVRLLLAAPTADTAEGLRDRAVLELLYATGLRAEELIALEVDELLLPEGDVLGQIRFPQRLLPIGRSAVDALRRYLRCRAEVRLRTSARSTLFVRFSGGRLRLEDVRHLVRRHGREALGRDDVNPRAIRMSLAEHLVARGASPHVVQSLLGLRTRHVIPPEEVQHVYAETHPLAPHARGFEVEDEALATPARAGVREAAGRSTRLDLNAWAECYLDRLRSDRTHAPTTIASYARDLETLCSHASASGVTTPEHFNVALISSYLASRYCQSASAATRVRRFSAVRGLTRFLLREDVIRTNPCDLVDLPRPARRLPNVLGVDDILRILETPTPEGFSGLRDRAILHVLYAAGVTVSELVGLQLVDVNLEKRLLSAGTTKKRLSRSAEVI